jgi:hypothetical protein
MRVRLDSLADQQCYLRDQLKTILKKTRIIEADIEFSGGRSMMSFGAAEVVDTQVPQSPACAVEDKLPPIKKMNKSKKKRLVLKARGSPGVPDAFIPLAASPSPRGAVVTMRALNARQTSNKSIHISPQEQLALLKGSRLVQF